MYARLCHAPDLSSAWLLSAFFVDREKPCPATKVATFSRFDAYAPATLRKTGTFQCNGGRPTLANCAPVENAHLTQIGLPEVLTIPYSLTIRRYLLELLTIP
jgi:hypothetical protein